MKAFIVGENKREIKSTQSLNYDGRKQGLYPWSRLPLKLGMCPINLLEEPVENRIFVRTETATRNLMLPTNL